MSDQQNPEDNTPEGMTYPCKFRVRAMGLDEDDFDALVVDIIRRHCPDIHEGAVHIRPSKNGKYVSVSVDIEAQSREHLDAIYDELTAHDRVLMRL
jgi:putative lipoic acid-binding regulatory protein